MGAYITDLGDYYEGDRVGADRAVPIRPGVEYQWVGVEWILDVNKARLLAKDRIIKDYEREISTISSGYVASEQLSWIKQEAEARAYLANQSANCPLITALAGARNLPVADLAARIIVKADTFAAISGALIGKRQALEDALDALPDDASAAQIAEIQW